MRVRRGIASEKEEVFFGRLGKARGQGRGHTHKEVITALRAMPIRPDPEDHSKELYPKVCAQYRRVMNARKRARRARR